MSGHRRRRLPPHEVRLVSNATAPAVATRRDDGLIIVDIDETLDETARDDALHAALAPFMQGRLSWIPVAFLPAAWRWSRRKVLEHERAAAAVAGAAVVAVAGTAALAVTGVLNGDDERPRVVAAATVTQTVQQAPPTTPAPAPATSLAPSRTGGPTRAPQRTRPAGGRPEVASNGAPERRAQPSAKRTQPSATRPPPRRSSPEPARTTKRPTRATATADTRDSGPVAEAGRDDGRPPSPGGRDTDRPTVDGPADHPTPDPRPEPKPEPDHAIEIGVGGPHCHLDLGIGVGHVLGADVCL